MAALLYAKRLAKKMGATIAINDEGRDTIVNADVPMGKTWDANGAHCLTASWMGSRSRPVWKEERNGAIADLVERMEMGLSDCDNPDCDWCHSEEL